MGCGTSSEASTARVDSAEPPVAAAATAKPALEDGPPEQAMPAAERNEALREAAKTGDADKVRALLAAGADINDQDSGGRAPLARAVFKGHAEVVKLLIDRGAVLDMQDKDGDSPLHRAAYWGHLEVVKVLIDAGAALNLQRKDGKTPLKIAVDRNKTEVAALLRAHGAADDAAAQQVTSEELAAIIATWRGVGDKDDKFSASKLSLGNPSDSDLREMLGLEDNAIFGDGMRDPVEAMKREWRQHGSEEDWANFRYVLEGRACDAKWIPAHVKETLSSGVYHGGSLTAADFDAGHDGWELQQFLELPSSVYAGLQPEHVLAVRLYTSDSFRLFNRGMREKTKPHPIRFSVYVLNDALKKLRKVVAKREPDEYNKVKVLWRGMKDMTLDFEQFRRTGGTELAPMSTTDNDSVAHSYAASTSGRGLIFEYLTQGNSRGVDIADFSMYPKEREFLYPPLTYLMLDASKSIRKLENGTVVVPIIPQMA